jgi:hypothetical protein
MSLYKTFNGGTTLSRKRGLQELPAEKRALLALDLIRGPTHATATHAARAVGLSKGYISTALHATDERARLARSRADHTGLSPQQAQAEAAAAFVAAQRSRA